MVESRKSLLVHLAAVALGAVVAWKVGQGIVMGPSLPVEWAFVMLAIVICIMILRHPTWGLYLFPIALFLVPTNTHLLDIRILSPPLMIGGMTLAASFAQRVIQGRRLHLSKPILIVIILIGWHLFYFLIDYGNDSGRRLYNFAQGSVPLFLAWLALDTPEQATRVMYAWTLAWIGRSAFLVIQFLRWISLTSVSFTVISRMTDEHIVSNVNQDAWIGTLFVPVLLALALNEQRWRFRIRWLAALIVALLGVLVTWSRAGLLGVSMSLVVFFLIERGRNKTLLPYLIGVTIWFAVLWQALSSFPFLEDRTYMMADVISERISWWQLGYHVFTTNPFMGVGPDDRSNPTTHSYVFKSAMEFGTLYVLLFAGLFGLLLHNHRQLLGSRLDPATRAVCLGITVATLVAIPQAFFGITFQASAYAMVFWVFQGVQMAYWNSIRRETPKRSGALLSPRKAMP